MKLNCDLGESFGNWQMGDDKEIMPYIDMANIACGFHASDPNVMANTIKLAKQHQVKIGAHPSYPDLQGFGRRNMSFNKQEIVNLVQYQIGALAALCAAQDVQVEYVKPHGALYNTMMSNSELLEAILLSLSLLADQSGNPLSLIILANNQSEKYLSLADKFSIPLIFEAFADRAYNDEGQLLPRNQQGAVLEGEDEILTNVKNLVKNRQVKTVNGKIIPIEADTICVHGDNAQALSTVKIIRQLISKE